MQWPQIGLIVWLSMTFAIYLFVYVCKSIDVFSSTKPFRDSPFIDLLVRLFPLGLILFLTIKGGFFQ